jgi:hypothetical protein
MEHKLVMKDAAQRSIVRNGKDEVNPAGKEKL